MNSIVPPLKTPDFMPAALLPFRAFLGYDGVVAGAHACRIYSWILAEFGNDLDFLETRFTFAQLADCHGAEAAASAAAQANLVILAAATPGLPEGMERWLAGWLDRREQRDGALAVLIGRQQGGVAPDSPLQRFAETAARRAGLSFFFSSFDLPTSLAAPDSDSGPRAHRWSHEFEEIFARVAPVPRWGLNE